MLSKLVEERVRSCYMKPPLNAGKPANQLCINEKLHHLPAHAEYQEY